MEKELVLMRRNTLGDLLWKNSIKFSDKIAITSYNEVQREPETITFKELNIAANRFADGLASLGVKKGDVAALMCHNCIQFVIAVWGFLKANITSTLVNVNLVGQEIAYQINDSDAKILFVEDSLVESVFAIKDDLKNVENFGFVSLGNTSPPDGWINIEDLYSDKYSEDEPDVEIRNNDIATRIYTSGTTAFPKGIDLTHANAEAVARSFAGNDGMGQVTDSNVGFFLPLYHSGMFHMICSISIGAHLVLGSISDIKGTMEIIEKEKVDVTVFPVTIFLRMLDYPDLQDKLRSLKMVGWFGGAMPLKVMEQWLKIFPDISIGSIWALTECLAGTTAWFNNTTGLPKTGNVIGRPMPYTVMKIVDEDDNEVSDGQPGEIVMRGPAIMKGYYKNKDATDEVFKNGWLHTGDVAYKEKNGYFYFVDRIKDMIKSGGVNVSSLDVEAILNTMEGIETSAVFGVPHPDWTEAVVAVVVKKDKSITEADVISHCKENLAKFKVPKRVIFLDEIPISHVGKILRKELRETYKDLFIS